MKLSKIKFPSSGYRSPLLSYWTVVVLIALLYVLTACQVGFGNIQADTPSYYAAGDLLFDGVVDDIRTPVYPIILHMLKAIFGFANSMIAVIVIQTIVFVISVIYVNKSIRLITPQSPRICFWVTIFYILLQVKDRWVGMLWVLSILSDALAIYCSAFLIYCMIRVAQPGASVRYAIWTTVWLLLLVFLRPVLICYIPVVVFFWIVLYLESRRSALKRFLIGIGGVVVVVVLLGMYCYELNRRYHIHSISFVGSANNYGMLRYGGIITPDDADDATFQDFIEKQIAIKADSLTAYEQMREIYKIFCLPSQFHSAVERAVSHAIKSNPQRVIRTLFHRYMEVNDSYVNLVNMLLLITGGVIVAYYRKYRQILPIQWTLFLFVISLWISMFIGAMYEWYRLSAPITPMLSILVGWAFSVLNIKPQSSNYYEIK